MTPKWLRKRALEGKIMDQMGAGDAENWAVEMTQDVCAYGHAGS